MSRLLRSLFLIAGFIGVASISHATVPDVISCPLYGPDFFYLPGPDGACFNPTTGDIRQQTTGGTWRNFNPDNSGTWVTDLKDACKGGRLLKVGTFTAADFTANVYSKYQTPLFPLNLKPGDFISSVILSGGFDVTNRSTFCLSFFNASTDLNTPDRFSPVGCQNTAVLRNQPAAFSFVPRETVPPSYLTGPLQLVGTNAEEDWGFPDPLTFNGALTCWVCLQHAGPGPNGPK